MVLKSCVATTMKLNNTSYLLRAQSIRLFVSGQKKMKHLIEAFPDTQDYSWLADDCCMITWLLNCMEVKVSVGVMFLHTAKYIWDTLTEMYANEKNISKMFELY